MDVNASPPFSIPVLFSATTPLPRSRQRHVNGPGGFAYPGGVKSFLTQGWQMFFGFMLS